MRPALPLLASSLFVLAAGAAPPVMAQDSFPACPSQQTLEQIINSDGALMPDGCRNLTITAVESDAGRLCVIDLSGADEGILQRLRQAALPEQWWVRCDRLGQN